MSSMQHAWLGNYEVSSTSCTGLTFARHSHDECVIGVNLLGEEQVWLDRRTFEAGPGSITLYNPGQIQGGGAAEGSRGGLSACMRLPINWRLTWVWHTWSSTVRCASNRSWR